MNENEVCALSMERDLVTTCIIIIDEALVEEALQFPSLFVPFSTSLRRVKLSSSSTPSLSIPSLPLDEASRMLVSWEDKSGTPLRGVVMELGVTHLVSS